MTTEMQSHFDVLLAEDRRYRPRPEFTSEANVSDPTIYEKAAADPEAFWAEQARELEWFTPWETVLEWDRPWAKWFRGGRMNASYNCLDRHLGTRGAKRAIVWEGEFGEERTLTYRELHREVCRFANVLKHLGLRVGDRVAIYMGMVPELPIAMLACARIGCPHSVVFGGFSPESLSDRINDAEARVLITQDGGFRRGSVVPLKQNADAALERSASIEHVVVLRRAGDRAPVKMCEGRDRWWHELIEGVEDECDAEPLDSEHMLYILYTSGTTGKPKGIVHTTAGYLLGTALTTKWVFDLKEDDVYWCTADIGWVTGHSYIVYGPLANGATVVMYEGAPDYPAKDRFWQIVERHRVTILYTSPTAIRAFMAWGREWVDKHDISSLRLIGSVGEPINPAAWKWYSEAVGKHRCPIVDTWWQTETGSILISPLPGATPTKPGSATLPLPGVVPRVVNPSGETVKAGETGYLVIERPWPSMLRTIYGDDERFRREYWDRIPGVYFTGDAAQRDADGYFWVLGRVDDVIKVAGHRLSTMEIESALVSYPAVAEAAVVGRPDELKGEAIVAFVTLRAGAEPSAELRHQVA